VSNVVGSKQELSIQVGDLDVIVICTVDSTSWRTCNTHKSESFDQLAPKCTSTNHEQVNLTKLLLELLTIDSNLIVVSTTSSGSVDLVSWKSLKDIEVKPLFHWRILSSELNDFLGDDTTKEGRSW
jgi:hypothetical protein|tara:strand:+ start:435 stop:812 length:378 start_codon:yes stop_codon:yes gene_type:complete